ncbi:MAG: hypothetical protein LBB73_05495 [Dysgonamonadaceae bacterium]|jgi:hypothetical protein|nr:hypothetical protein [Dysgonamonadaceae bacterium]
MATKSKIQEKREYLKALSNSLKILKTEGAIKTVNGGLKAQYARQEHTELKTLQQWNAAGKRTGKGESALLLRAKPKKINIHNPSDRTGTAEEENAADCLPVCFVFSNLQLQEA